MSTLPTLRLVLAAGASFSVLALATASMAQSVETRRVFDETTQLEEVIVTAPDYVPSGSLTATKTGAPLIETPQSISVVSRDQIDLLNFIDVQQAVRYTAGIVGENYGPDIRYDFLTQRGFIPAQYVDGLLAPVSASIVNNGVDLYGFESVEVLRGPSGSLYGNTPPGGLYNLTSRRPDGDFGGELQAKYGTDDFKQIAGTITGSVTEGVSARLTALYRDRGSQTDHVSAERTYIAPAVTWEITPGTDLTVLGHWQSDRNNGDTNGFLPVLGVLVPNPSGEVSRGTNLGEPDYNRYDRDQWTLGYGFEHRFSDTLKLVQNLQYSDYEEDQLVIYGSGLLADNRTVTRSNFPYRDDVKQLAVDTRVEGEFQQGAVRHTLLAGLDYRDYDEHSEFGFAGASNIDLFNPVYGAGGPIVTPSYFTFTDQELKQTGLYLQDQVDFGQFILTVSGRQDWVKQTNHAAGDAVTKQDQFSWRIGGTYVLDNGLAPYVSYATSFTPVVGTDVNGAQFEPSESEQYEAGIKWDARNLPDDVSLFATAAVYQLTQTNIVTAVPVTPVSSIQTGEAEVKGFELEAVGRIRNQWAVNASYTYADTEVTRSNGPDLGGRLTGQPKHKLSLFADYTIQSGALGGLGFGVGGRYLSDTPGSQLGAFNPTVYYSPSVTLWDAIIHYDTPDWRFAVNGSNIFDKKYAGRCSGQYACFYGQGQQVFATVSRKF